MVEFSRLKETIEWRLGDITVEADCIWGMTSDVMEKVDESFEVNFTRHGNDRAKFSDGKSFFIGSVGKKVQGSNGFNWTNVVLEFQGTNLRGSS
jgi:hypothetical protein